jgi:hypothetical protein
MLRTAVVAIYLTSSELYVYANQPIRVTRQPEERHTRSDDLGRATEIP